MRLGQVDRRPQPTYQISVTAQMVAALARHECALDRRHPRPRLVAHG